MSCCPKLETLQFDSALCGSGIRLWWCSSATTCESSAASMSHSCANTRLSLSKPEPLWLRLDLGDMRYARLFREETGITFPLLVDSERTAYKAAELKSGNLFRIFWRENAEARSSAKAGGFRQHRLGKNPFQLGASFIFCIFCPGNRDLFVHFNRTFSDNADPRALLSALERGSK